MAREVKIHEMPEKQESFMDSVLAKILGTIIASLLIVILGQGLVIWKNQDAFHERLIDAEEELMLVKNISERLLTLEGNKASAYSRLEKLEGTTSIIFEDRQQRGGTFRRDDAEALKTNIFDRISIEDGRIAALEYKMNNAEKRIEECRKERDKFALQEDLKDLEEEVELLESEHESAYAELSDRCSAILNKVKED